MATMATTSAQQGLALIRCVLAVLIFVHGAARVLADGVVPFGGFLETRGFPLGVVLAWAITPVELVAAPLLAWGRWVTPLALVFSAIYACGIWLVHASAGWFVVGLGRNGAEYSVLLITGLLANAWAHRRRILHDGASR
jgi:putative oxidoreductase